MKIVLDTNVLMSGLMYPDSTPGMLVNAWREGQFEVATSFYQLEEIGRVLAYPKVGKILKWDREDIESFLKQLLVKIELIEPADAGMKVPLYPADTPILAILVAAKADVFVTGDSDLLALCDDFPILKPADFARKL